jgi:hypothetical protein
MYVVAGRGVHAGLAKYPVGRRVFRLSCGVKVRQDAVVDGVGDV